MNKLNFALQMEIDGEQYYLKQAELNKNNAMAQVFQILAKAESTHAELIRRLSGDFAYGFKDDLLPAEPENLFSGLGDFKRDAAYLPGQLEVYRLALDMEQKSIDLYQGMLAETTEESPKKLLAFLIKQEQDHFALFDELVTLLSRPKDWVEAAEFGPRDNY